MFFLSWKRKTNPREIGRIQKDDSWLIRWFPNKFPIVEEKEKNVKDRLFLKSNPPFGRHEIIVETPDSKKQLADLSIKNLKQVLEVYKLRIEEIQTIKNVRYVIIFKNKGVEAGTSIAHSHSQIVALNSIPPIVFEEAKKSIEHRKCLYCNILKIELKSPRKVFENKTMLAFHPMHQNVNMK